MEMEALPHENFDVNFSTRSVIKASGPLPEPHILSLSNLDLLSGRYPVTYFYFYRKSPDKNSAFITDTLKNSLAKTLTYYYPFAGRIIQNPDTDEPEIVCDNTGALFLEAKANISLKHLDFYNLNHSFSGKLVSIKPDFPLQVQVTIYTCGGVSVTASFDHALGDGTAFGKFLVSWSEIARQKPLTCIPDHGRSLRARCPPTYHPSLDRTFVKCSSLEEIMNPQAAGKITLKRLYYIDASSVKALQQLACVNGKKRTQIEAFSAYVWKILATTIDDQNHEKCKMGWLVDGRSRIHGSQSCMSGNYIGNVLSMAQGEASVKELKQGSLSDIANKVHASIAKVANEEHFLDLIDWIECHRPGLMLSRMVLGGDGPGPAVVVSSGRRYPVAEVDFGFGNPVLGTTSTTLERIGVGYMNQRPSASCDGSWIVSAILWPELVAALESDTIFQPLCASHLHL